MAHNTFLHRCSAGEKVSVADDPVQEDIKKWYESKDQKQTMSELLGSRRKRSEKERAQAPARGLLIDSKSVTITKLGEDCKEFESPPQDCKLYISARYRKMDGANIVDMVEKDHKHYRRVGKLISKLSKWFGDGTSKSRCWVKKVTISTTTEFEGRYSSIKKNRPEVDHVELPCQCEGRIENSEGLQGKIANKRERVQHRGRGVAKRIMSACGNLCIKQKPVPDSHTSYSGSLMGATHERRSEYSGKSKRSPSRASEQRQTAGTALAKDTENYRSKTRVEKEVTPVTKTDASNDFSFFSALATLNEKKEKLLSTSQSNGVRINKAKIESQSKQREDYLAVIFQEIEGESPCDREQRYESFKDHQFFPRAEKKIEAIRQQEGALQLQQDQNMKVSYALDSRIQKWSRGNEGNLRALLSTLDNALWPGCNWEMVPASELVTTGSVKQVYRKATFCLHPDKVQQRGGTIEQIYIAQIVFGVLREAWNKFHREELG